MTSPAPEPRPLSTRVQLARVAADAALDTPGVVELDSGPTGTAATVGGGVRVPGVACSVAPEGGYDLRLRLICALVDLPRLAEQVRAAVDRAAADAGITVTSVTIDIVDVVEPASC